MNKILYLGQTVGQPVSTFNGGPVFLYHPLTPALTEAFGAMLGGGMPGGLILNPGGIIRLQGEVHLKARAILTQV